MNRRRLKGLSFLIVLLIMFGSLSFFSFMIEAAEGDYIDSWDTSGESGDPVGLCTDGTNIWIVDYLDDEVYKYTMAGVYVDSWDTSGEGTDPMGVATDGNFIWTVDSTDDEVYKYTMAGNYVNSWDTSVQSGDPRGITTDGTNIWIVDFLDDEVYKYHMNGTYVDSWDTSGEGDVPFDITTDGNYIWTVDTTDKEVYKYTMAGVYVNSWDTSGESDSPRGICTSGTYIWVSDDDDDEVYKYEYRDPPVCTSASITDMDDIDNCYGMTFYDFQVKVADAEGATTIEKVYLRILQESAIRAEVRATNLTGTPAWAIHSNGTIIDLNAAACSFTIDNPWWDYDWRKRIQLTFDNSASSENLVGFPVLVNLTSAVVSWADIQDDADDLRFIDADNVTVLDYEIEDYNETANAAYIWVEVPQIDAGSVTDHIWMYYNNSGASSGEDAEGTWNTDYVMVQHMVDTNTSAILDSTQYDNDGLKKGPNEPIETANGEVNGAQLFDGSDDMITIGDSPELRVSSLLTFEAWIKPNASGGTGIKDIISKGDSYQLFSVESKVGPNTNVYFYLAGTTASAWVSDCVVELFDGSLHYIVGTYDKDAGINNQKIYVDGVNVAQQTNTLGVTTTIQAVTIGKHGAHIYNGTIDETRISNTSRSADWIEAQYLSMTDSLISFGSSEAGPFGATAVFSVAFEWDYTQEDDLELAVYVEDLVGLSAGWTTKQTNYVDVVTRLVTYNFGANVSSTSIDHPIELTGYVKYATTATGNLASTTSPPDGQFTSVQIQNDQEEIVGTDVTIVDGFFNAIFNASSVPRTTMYYAYLDLLDDYVDGLAPDGDVVYVATNPAFYLSELIDQAFSTFGILDYIVNATAYGTALGAYFIDSITNITQLITQQFVFVLGIFDFFIDWYTRMMSLVVQIGGIITGLIDGTGDVTSGLGDLWNYFDVYTWIDIIPVVLFIWWVESIATRGERSGEITVFLGDMQTVMNVTSWFLSMFSMIINTVTDLAFRLLGVIT